MPASSEVEHWASAQRFLQRARQRPGKAKLPPSPTPPEATPWDLRLGRDSVVVATEKLNAAGFRRSILECLQVADHAPYGSVSLCQLEGSVIHGMESSQVTFVGIGSGDHRIAELEYRFKSSAYDDVIAELTRQYGEPIQESNRPRHWFAGPVGIEVMVLPDAFTVSYFHGRLRAVGRSLTQLSEQAEKVEQHRGF